MALTFAANRLTATTKTAVWKSMKQSRDRLRNSMDFVGPLSVSQKRVSDAESAYLLASQQRQLVEDELARIHSDQATLHTERKLSSRQHHQKLHDDLNSLVQMHELNKRERLLSEQLRGLAEREEMAFCALGNAVRADHEHETECVRKNDRLLAATSMLCGMVSFAFAFTISQLRTRRVNAIIEDLKKQKKKKTTTT